ncbi:MAG: penicillin-binding protein [Actinobacteria bacterium]|nr:penicillin-binding protein [Actinomycetota bacterium]
MATRRARVPPHFLHRLKGLPWARIIGATLVAVVVVGLVPPLRRAVAVGTSKAILFVASPLAPPIADFKKLPETTRLLATDGSLVAELDKAQRREAIELKALPKHVPQAVLAAEDEDFYQHSGVDPKAVFRAFLRTASGQTQGGSTITQQLAKINYTARQRTILRKLKEVLYATRLERRYSKDELLERYLNQVYFGEGAYGINAASQTYFAKTADQLSPAQAAVLAGKIKSPEGLDPRKRPKQVTARRNQVLANMREEGFLDEGAYQQARAEPLELAPPTAAAQGKAPHFVEFVKREAKSIDALGASPETRTSQLFTGGYTIETTLDPKVFDATVAAVQNQLGQPGDPVTAVATVAPGDGAIRTLFGGLDFSTTQFDMSSLAGRQAGSAFKPFTYLTALREGIDPRSTFDGTSGRVIPCYGDRPVNNYAGEDAGGRIDVDEAMVKSVNVVFVDLGCHVGVRDVIKTATTAGIPEDATKVQGAVFLGGLDNKGVNALEMAASFATFAAKGTYAQPYAIARIKDRDGRVIFEHDIETRQAFRAEEVGVLNNPLQGVVRNGTGTAAAIGRPVAGKTGTTQDNIDAWFVGYTPQLATGVWVGFPQPQPMTNVHGRAVTGGSFPAQIFGEVMKAAHQGLPVKSLHTASPDQLNLKLLSPTTSVAPTTSSSSTTSSSTTSSTTTTSTTTSTSIPGGFMPPGRSTSTTTPPASSTTTTTTTKKTPPTTTSSTSSTSSTSTTAPP